MRRVVSTVGLFCVAVGSALLVAASDGSPSSGAMDDDSVTVKVQGYADSTIVRATSDYLPCTGPDEMPNFETYSAGPNVGDLRITAAVRQCLNPVPSEEARAAMPEHPVRMNSLTYVYGDCDPPTDPATGLADGGCAPPLEIQTWPACERSAADVMPEPVLEESDGSVIGRFGNDTRVEVYTGGSTVVIFASDSQLMKQAIEQLQRDSDAAIETVASSEMTELGAPSQETMDGNLACDA